MAAYAAIFGESVKGLAPNSYNTYPVSDEAWAEVQSAFAASAKEPENEELKTAARAKYKENVKAVCDKEEEKFSLDPKKAEILQELVDRYALNK